MSHRLRTWSLVRPLVDDITEEMDSKEDKQKRVLSIFSLDTRSSTSEQEPSLNVDGFRRISNPLDWPPISDQHIAEPLYLAIPEYLHSIETLQFMGFQRAVAEYIFADFTSPERKDGPSPLPELAKEYITAAEVTAEQNSRREGQPMETDTIKCINLVQVYMGIDFEGAALDLIDEPKGPLCKSAKAIVWMRTINSR